MKNCPFCNEEVDDEAIICENCGRAIFNPKSISPPKKTIRVTASSSLNEVKDKSVKKCPYCAEIIKKEAIVCRYCGRRLETGPLGGFLWLVLVICGLAISSAPFFLDAIYPDMMGQNILLCWGPGAILIIAGIVSFFDSR